MFERQPSGPTPRAARPCAIAREPPRTRDLRSGGGGGGARARALFCHFVGRALRRVPACPSADAAEIRGRALGNARQRAGHPRRRRPGSSPPPSRRSRRWAMAASAAGTCSAAGLGVCTGNVESCGAGTKEQAPCPRVRRSFAARSRDLLLRIDIMFYS